MLAIGVSRVWPGGWDIDPGDQGRIGGQCNLDFVQRRDLAPESSVLLHELGLEFAHGDAGQLALAFQVFESLGALGLVEVLGHGLNHLVEPLQRGS